MLLNNVTALQALPQSNTLDTMRMTEFSAITSSLCACVSFIEQISRFPGLLRTEGARNDEVIEETSVISIVSNTPDWWETRNDEVIAENSLISIVSNTPDRSRTRNDESSSNVLDTMGMTEASSITSSLRTSASECGNPVIFLDHCTTLMEGLR